MTATGIEPIPCGHFAGRAGLVSEGNRPRLLLISASDYQSAVIKGVVPLLADFDERGFFEHVLIAFPFARTSCEAKVSERVVARDLGTDWLPFASGFRTLRRAAAPIHVARAVALLILAVRRHRLDIVRATDPFFSGLVGWVVARLTGRPLCVSIHADWDKRHALAGLSSGATLFGFRSPAKAIERFVLSRAEMVMPIRESLRTYAIRSGARAESIRVVPHGADLQPFVIGTNVDVYREFQIRPRTHIISFVGRLVRENYVDDVIELARRLVRVRQDFRILMIGGGIDASRLKTSVEEDPALRAVISFPGFQPQSIVAAVRRASSVNLCLMGGYSLIEACASGTPVVSYDVEWHSELVQNGETGFLLAEHDVDAAQAVVNRLLDDPNLRESMGAAARRLALLRHDLARTSEIKRECYVELLSAHRHLTRGS